MKTDRFKTTISNKDKDEEVKTDRFNWNEGLKTVGDTLVGIFREPDNITNTTVVQPEEDNTMLYAGLGGAALLVVLLIVFLK